MQLGELTGNILKELHTVEDFLDDPITVAYGVGGEMVGLVQSHALGNANAMLALAGYTPAEFLAEVQRRCSPKWVYFSGLNMLEEYLEDTWRAERQGDFG